MQYKTILLSVLFLLIFACNKVDHTLLHGKWKGAMLTQNGEQIKKTTDNINFHFYPNGTYTYSVANFNEAGNFRTFEDKLYTTDTLQNNRLEKVVKIARISTDSLFIEMNAGGVPQVLKCYKVAN